MLREYRLYQVDAFTNQLFSGNPAGVISNADGLSDDEMQLIARELNNSETAFVLSAPEDALYDVEVRFFTPRIEVPLCGHATVAAHFVLATESRISLGGGGGRCVQKTGAGVLPVDINIREGALLMTMTQPPPEYGRTLNGDELQPLLTALELAHDTVDPSLPPQIVSTGFPALFLAVRDRGVLNNLSPDFGLLNKASANLGLGGLHLFTSVEGADVPIHGRMFAPGVGVPEDPVTGTTSGALGAYLVRHRLDLFTEIDAGVYQARLQQGEALGRSGQVLVTVGLRNEDQPLVRVSGEARIVFSSTLTL